MKIKALTMLLTIGLIANPAFASTDLHPGDVATEALHCYNLIEMGKLKKKVVDCKADKADVVKLNQFINDKLGKMEPPPPAFWETGTFKFVAGFFAGAAVIYGASKL